MADVVAKLGERIRPSIDVERAKEILYEFYGFGEKEILQIRELESYDDKNFYVKIKRKEINGYDLDAIDGLDECKEFILKIMNTLDSQKNHADAEHSFREHLNQNGFSCPRTIRNLSDDLKFCIPLDQDVIIKDITNSAHVVRLLTYVPGTVFGDAPGSAHMFRSVGRYLADLHAVTKDFRHPELENHQSIWLLENLPHMRSFLPFVPDEWKTRILKIVEDFEEMVLPQMCNLEQGTIHGDFNDRNIIVKQFQNDLYEVCGVIDFGDLSTTCLVFDLAITMTYVIMENKGTFPDPVNAGGCVLAGYASRRPLSERELKVLPYCVMARYAQSLSLGAYSYARDPANEYLLISAREGWTQLGHLIQLGPERLLKIWLKSMD